MTKQWMTACPLTVSLILACGPALADPGQEQACAGRVSEMRDIPMSDVRVTRTEGSKSGIATVDLIFPGGSATCWVDREYNIHDMHFSRHPERQRRSSSSNKDATGDANAQEQACASRMADEVNERMSSVRVIQSNAYIMGSRQVTMSTPGMKALCTADIHNNVVFFKFIPPD